MKEGVYLIVLLLVTSCAINVEPDIENIERILEVKLEDGYKITNKKYDYGIGDSVKSFDIIFTEAAFDLFFNEVKNKFLIIDKNIVEDVQIKNDFYKNIDLEGMRIHMSINLSKKKLHYAIVDL